jgi:RNA polymerase sigma factor for flagellar operon FliA
MGKRASQEDPVAKLWLRYARWHGSVRLRNELVEHYLDWAHDLGRRYAAKFPHDPAAVDSAVSLALIRVVELFEPDRPVAFTTYANPRITGAVIDELRRADHLGRATRTKGQRRDSVAADLAQRLGRPPTTEEIDRKGVPAVMAPKLQSLNRLADIYTDFPPDRPRRRFNEHFFREATRQSTNLARTVLYLRMRFAKTERQIGEFLDYSEARISQVITEAVGQIRASARNVEVRHDLFSAFALRGPAAAAE